MINMLEMTIGKYVNVGTSIALDETCIGMYHSMAKSFIYYNAENPRRKHHCNLYALCENVAWILINFKFCHRSYNNKGGIEDDGEVTDKENEYEEVPKLKVMKKEVKKEKTTKKTKKQSTKSKETKKEKEKREK